MPPAKLAAALKQFPASALALAAFYTFLNYLILTGYDQLAFIYIRRPIAKWQIAMASFVGYAIANNVGFALLSGTSARYRFYSRWGSERTRDLARGAFLLGHVLAGPARAGRMGARRRTGGEPRRVRGAVAGPRDRLDAARNGVRLPGRGALPPQAHLDRRPRRHAAVDLAGTVAVRPLSARLEPGRSGVVRAPAGTAARFHAVRRRVPGRAARRAREPCARRPGRLRIADDPDAAAAGGGRSAGARDVPADLLPRATRRRARRPHRRRVLPPAPCDGAVGECLRHADHVRGTQAAGRVHPAWRRRADVLGRDTVGGRKGRMAEQFRAAADYRGLAFRREPASASRC